jgi:NADH dehydrogenase
LTGGGGFIGSRLLPALLAREYPVVVLDRSGRIGDSGLLPESHIVRGDLLAPDSYRGALASTDIVVHLAASTGRASSDEHWRVNAVGTETLINACRAARVHGVVGVSSIATTFGDLRGYPYAQAKIYAERAVETSGLPHIVLRPTMVLGPGSPILAALSRLALLPAIPIFGTGRTLVQPVHVDDVVSVILAVLERERFPNETIDVGGPEALPIEELLQQIRVARTGRRGRVWHVPLGAMLPALNAAEAVGLGSLLPFSVGQLATFRFPGMAAPQPGVAPSTENRIGVQEMVAPPAPAARDRTLEGECHVFTRHLIGGDPTPYIVEHYVRAHQASGRLMPGDRFDRLLVRIAARHRLLARCADSYARVFVPASLLRRKLVLLLAILETAPETHRVIDAPPGGGAMLIAGRLIGQGVLWLAGLLAAAVLLAPVQLAIGQRKRR